MWSSLPRRFRPGATAAVLDEEYVSDANRSVPLAREGEFRELRLGSLAVWPPVVLAPMAGVTNAPFRTICRRFGAGLYVSEMITARGLVEGNRRTLHLANFAPDERPRSLQLYSVDPTHLGEAVRRLVAENAVDHIDLNFGCPVRKVTRRGGGAAIPWRIELFRRLVAAAVDASGPVPLTVKFRKGIDDTHLTFLEAGTIAAAEGASAVALHSRTAAQLYDGHADWEAIAALKDAVTGIPVLGNGDIWEAHDALRMMRETRCDGVVVGRGCLGRPWLFRDLADVFDGRSPEDPPKLRVVFEVLREHGKLLSEWFGEVPGMRSLRKHATWYTKGFRGGAKLRQYLMRVSTLAELDRVLDAFPGDEAFPPAAMRVIRGKTGGTQRVALPDGWLDDRNDPAPPGADAEDAFSGG